MVWVVTVPGVPGTSGSGIGATGAGAAVVSVVVEVVLVGGGPPHPASKAPPLRAATAANALSVVRVLMKILLAQFDVVVVVVRFVITVAGTSGWMVVVDVESLAAPLALP